MSNLLEKASIITTPTAYDNGKILSVKPAKTFGSELVTNGTFDTDTDWIKGGAWSISGGTANYNDSTNASLYQNVTLNANIYELKFSISNSSGSGARIWIGNSSGSVSYTDNTYEYYTDEDYTLTINVPSNQTTFAFWGNTTGSSFSIDNVSVKEVIDGDFDFTRNSSATRVNSQGLIEDVQILSSNLVSNGDFSQEGSELVTNGNFATDSDWSKGTGWSISGGKGIVTNATAASIYQDVLTLSKSYKASFTISSIENGSLKIGIGLNFSQEFTEVGTYTYYGTPSNDSLLRITPSNGTNATIDNVSVKEVGQDWTFTSGATLTALGAKITHTPSAGSVSQPSILTIGKSYKLTYEITESISGGLKFNSAVNPSMVTTVGVHTKYLEADNTIVTFGRTSSSNNDVTITNISVVEITDDTNLPRIDYTGGTGHWLFEPQSTNLLPYSEDFTQWNKVNYTVQPNAAVSPSGGFDASFVTNPSGGGGNIKQNLNVTASTTYIFSFYAKRGTASDAKYSVYDNTNGGDIIPSTSYYSQINSDTFTRITVLFTTPVGCTSLAAYILRDSASAGNTIIWGAQVEASSYATSYIPTNGSTVTRLQDAAFGAGSSDLINSTEGVLYGEIAVLEGQTNINRYITINNGTDDNIVSIHFRNNALNQIRAIVKVGNSNQCDIFYNAAGSTSFAKFALKWKVNDFAFWVNGVKIGDDLSGISFNANTLNNISFDSGQGNDKFFGKTKCVAVFKEALTDEELTCLTTI